MYASGQLGVILNLQHYMNFSFSVLDHHFHCSSELKGQSEMALAFLSVQWKSLYQVIFEEEVVEEEVLFLDQQLSQMINGIMTCLLLSSKV